MPNDTPTPTTTPDGPRSRLDQRVGDVQAYINERNDIFAAVMPMYVGKQANAYSAALEMTKTCLLANAGGLAAVQAVVTILKLNLTVRTILVGSAGVSALFLLGFIFGIISLFALRRWADLDAKHHLHIMNESAASISLAHGTVPEERDALMQRCVTLAVEAALRHGSTDKMAKRIERWQIASCILLALGIVGGVVFVAFAKGIA